MIGQKYGNGYAVVSGRIFYKDNLVVSYTSPHISLILKECHANRLGDYSWILKNNQNNSVSISLA